MKKKEKGKLKRFYDYLGDSWIFGTKMIEAWCAKKGINWTVNDLMEGKVGWNLKYKNQRCSRKKRSGSGSS